jgi:CxxC-x17-CxxC domain-containing protein
MVYTDRSLTCSDCNAEFTFTASEQDFYAAKGFVSDPRRCPDCRAARKRNRSDNDRGGQGSYERQMHDTVCSECGRATQVPFIPSGSRPVYCSDCFRSQRGDSRSGGRRW